MKLIHRRRWAYSTNFRIKTHTETWWFLFGFIPVWRKLTKGENS